MISEVLQGVIVGAVVAIVCFATSVVLTVWAHR